MPLLSSPALSSPLVADPRAEPESARGLGAGGWLQPYAGAPPAVPTIYLDSQFFCRVALPVN